MKVKDIMDTNVVHIVPNAPVSEAARLMRVHGVGVLPVMEKDQVVGVVTDRDLVVQALARGWSAMVTLVRAVMSEHVAWCFEDAEVENAAQLMACHHTHRLLVFRHDLTVCGIVSVDDIAVALRDEKIVGDTLRSISYPAVAHRIFPESVQEYGLYAGA